MHFSTATILAATSIFLNLATAAPTLNNMTTRNDALALKPRDDCKVWAGVVETWHEDALSRRRLKYACTKSGQELGWGGLADQFLAEGAPLKCSAINNNIAAYYHKAYEAWVLDYNQVLGAAGDSASSCLVDRFKDKISRASGCQLE